MKILVIGANGKIGRKVVSKLAQNNHEVMAMVRNEDQKQQFEKKHVTPVLGDLEKDLTPVFAHKPDVVIFSAGSGGHTGKDMTTKVDLQGARKAIDESKKHSVEKFIMVSALGANSASETPASMQHYFVAKSEADQYLVQSGLNYTILRPGRLTDEQGSGNIQMGINLDTSKGSDVSRDNVANVIAQSVDAQGLNQKVLELLDGDTPIPAALKSI
jgi:uncharacterized protein YbjT (DUF2867 family)